MKIGIIGIGSLTLELAFRSAHAGYTITVNNPRGNSLVKEVIVKMGSNVTLGSLEQATAADIILLFLPKDDLENVIKNLPDMSGKLILHTSSLIFDPKSLLSGVTGAMTYKITASLLPEAHIIKLFKPVNLKQSSKCIEHKNKEEIFFISDHEASRDSIRNLLKKMNFLPIDISGKLRLGNTAIKLNNSNAAKAGTFKENLNGKRPIA